MDACGLGCGFATPATTSPEKGSAPANAATRLPEAGWFHPWSTRLHSWKHKYKALMQTRLLLVFLGAWLLGCVWVHGLVAQRISHAAPYSGQYRKAKRTYWRMMTSVVWLDRPASLTDAPRIYYRCTAAKSSVPNGRTTCPFLWLNVASSFNTKCRHSAVGWRVAYWILNIALAKTDSLASVVQ